MPDRGESDFIRELRSLGNEGEYHSTEVQTKTTKSSRREYTDELESNQLRSLKTRPAVRRY